MTDATYRADDLEAPISEQGNIMKGGVTIGENSLVYAQAAIVAAGATVTRDVPDFAIVGGTAAEIIGMSTATVSG